MRYLYLLITLLISVSSFAYPIDGYKYTGIDRLAYHWKLYQDSTLRDPLDPGAHLLMKDIKLNLTEMDVEWPEEEDEALKRRLNNIFAYLEPQYSLSIMDISDPKNIRYAGRKEDVGYQPGSVGKLAVAIAFFNELEKVYGDDWEAIRGLLYTKRVKAGVWGVPNHHTVPFYDVKKDRYYKRHVTEKDVFTLYEWLDHMLSKSSNAAASILMRETMLIHALDVYYECADFQDMDNYFEITDRSVLTDLMEELMNCPLRDIGIEEDEWRLGGFFTRGAERYVGRKGGSIGTTKGLMKFMFALDKGEVINERISLELKRLMYLTDRRIRYASAKILDDHAVYFKSGSLYSFYDEPGFVKREYAGNRYNYMNSIAMIERQDSTEKKYLVSLMSNVLRKNSVGEHYALAYRMDELISDED